MLVRCPLQPSAPMHKRAFFMARILAGLDDPFPPWLMNAARYLARPAEMEDFVVSVEIALPLVEVPMGQSPIVVAFERGRANPIPQPHAHLQTVGVIGATAFYLSQLVDGDVFYMSLETIRHEMELNTRTQAKHRFDLAVRRGYIEVVNPDWSVKEKRSRPLRLGPFFSDLSASKWAP